MTDDEQDNDQNKIIRFPENRERAQRNREKEKTRKEALSEQKKRERQEEQWRIMYKNQKINIGPNGNTAQKAPFFNFSKIPAFTRLIVSTLILIQVGLTFLLNNTQKLEAFNNFGFTPGAFTGTAPFSALAWITPITSLFLHGSFMHLAFNIVMMLAMGMFFEKVFGFRRTAIFFFSCGLIGSLTYFILSPFSNIPVVGASGAISGILAVTFLLLNEQGSLGNTGKRGALPFILIWLVIIVGTGLISTDTAWQAHLGGFLGGLGLFYLWRKGVINF